MHELGTIRIAARPAIRAVEIRAVEIRAVARAATRAVRIGAIRSRMARSVLIRIAAKRVEMIVDVAARTGIRIEVIEIEAIRIEATGIAADIVRTAVTRIATSLTTTGIAVRISAAARVTGDGVAVDVTTKKAEAATIAGDAFMTGARITWRSTIRIRPSSRG